MFVFFVHLISKTIGAGEERGASIWGTDWVFNFSGVLAFSFAFGSDSWDSRRVSSTVVPREGLDQSVAPRT